MQAFSYFNPVRTVFENGAVRRLGGLLEGAYRDILLLCADGPLLKNGVYGEVRAQLEASGARVHEMGPVASNPKLSSVYEGVEAAVSSGADCVAALGGGSAMDCAKLIAVSARTGVDPYEYVWGGRPAPTGTLDTVMIPSIAATGTELNDSAVIVNERTREKYWCQCAFPRLCVMDPRITATLPLRLTVWGAMDILSHTFEYYLNGNMESEFQLCFSEAILKAAMRALERLTADPLDLGARGEMLWCSTMTWGGGLTKVGRGEPDMTCHCIEESFSGYFDTHHGGCLGVLTPRWMRFVSQKRPAPFERFARNVMGVRGGSPEEAAAWGIDAYVAWLDRVGAPKTYRDLDDRIDFSEERLRIVADNAWRIYKGRIGRLYPMGYEEILEILLSGAAEI